MKKLKHFLSALFAVAMIAVLALATACDSCSGEKEDETPAVLQSIVLNTDNVKKEYESGEIFNFRGLVVTAKYNKGEDKVVTSKAKIDSSAFNNTVDGTYEIVVSYTEEEVTKTASYNVTVSVPALTSIELNTESVKKAYYNHDEFTADGLVVTAHYDKASDSNVTALAQIDSSAFDNTQAGTYNIVVSYTDNGVTKTANYDVTVELRTLQSITVNTENAITNYGGDDEFVTDGLVVMAHYDKGEDKNVTSLVQIDSSAFNSKQDGTYEIGVSYTEDDVTKTASYNVTVTMIADGTGLKVSLAEGVDNVIRLGNGTTSATIDKTAIEVLSVGADGKVRKVLEPDEYTVELYKGETKLTSGENLGEGVYQIWASIPYYEDNTITIEGFAYIYVINPVESIAFNSEANGTVTEQDAGSDKMSSTWTFTATFADGTTKQLTKDDVKLGTLDTRTAGEHSVTVTYSVDNILGETQTVETEVTYTINEVSGVVPEPVRVNIGQLSEIETLVTSYGTVDAATSFNYQLGEGITVIGAVRFNANSYSSFPDDSTAFTHRLQLRGAGDTTKRTLKFDLLTSATIKVYARGGATRTFNFYDASGTAVTNNAEVNDTNGLVYTYTATEAGTYYAWGTNGFDIYNIEIIYTGTLDTATKSDVKVNIGQLSEIESLVTSYGTADAATSFNYQLGEGITVIGAVRFNANSYSSFPDDSTAFTHRMQLRGAGDTTKRCIKFEVEAGATIKVYARGGATRTFNFYNASGTAVTNNAEVNDTNGLVYTYTATEAGTYYAWGTNGFDIYYIEVAY